MFDVTLVCVTPSDHFRMKGVSPTMVAVIVALPPVQMFVLPLTTAVGIFVFTVKVALVEVEVGWEPHVLLKITEY